MDSIGSGHERSLTEQIEQLEALLKASPGDPWLTLQLSQFYLVDGQFVTAESLAQETLDRSNVESAPAIVATCLETLGLVALSKGDYETAIDRLTSGLQIQEGLGELGLLGHITYNLATAYWASGELEQAIILLERAEALLPASTLIHDALVKAYDATRMPEKQQQAMSHLMAVLTIKTGQSEGDRPKPDKAQGDFRQGIALELEGNYEQAVIKFQEAITGGFADAEAYRRLGICLSELGHFREAVQALKTSIEINPRNPISHFDLAIIFQRLGMTYAEMKEYNQTISLEPAFLDAYVNLMQLHLRANQPELAQNWAKKAIQVVDTDARIYFLYGQANLAQGKLAEGYNAWRKALELVQDDHLREVYEDRLRYLEQEIFPSDFEQRESASEILTEGLRLKNDGQPEGAILYFERACQIDPYFFEAHKELAFAYLQVDKVQQAQEIFQKLRLEHPDDQEAQLGLGMALIQSGKFSEAKDALTNVYDLGAQTWAGKEAKAQLTKLAVRERWGNLPVQRYDEALEHMASGQLKEAIDVMQEAVALAPNTGLFCAELGWLYLLADSVDDAIRQFELAIKIEPQGATHYCNLGTALLKKGKAHEAMSLLQKAIALDPTEGSFHNAMGGCYTGLDEHIQAEIEFRKAIELDQDQQDAWTNLCQNLIHQKKYQQASDELGRISTLFPNTPLGKQAQEWLDTISKEQKLVLEQSQTQEVTAKDDAVEQLCHEGLILDRAGYTTSAIEKYQEAAMKDFEAFDPHFRMGNAYARLEQYDQAISEFALAVSMQATNSQIADAYYNMANSHMALKDFARATDNDLRAVKVYPNIRDARLHLGICLAAQGQFEEAIEFTREELRLHPDEERSKAVHGNLGQWLLQVGKELEALFELRKAELMPPEVGVYHEQIGRIFTSRNLWNLAQAEFEVAMHMKPDNDAARAAIEVIRFVEYEIPLLTGVDNPRVQHSLKQRRERIGGSFPMTPKQFEIIKV